MRACGLTGAAPVIKAPPKHSLSPNPGGLSRRPPSRPFRHQANVSRPPRRAVPSVPQVSPALGTASSWPQRASSSAADATSPQPALARLGGSFFPPTPQPSQQPVTPSRADPPGLVCPSAPEGSDQTRPEAARGPAPACPALRGRGAGRPPGPVAEPAVHLQDRLARGDTGPRPEGNPSTGDRALRLRAGALSSRGPEWPPPSLLGGPLHVALTPSASSVMEWPGLAWGGASLDRCVPLVLLTAGADAALEVG